MEKFSSTPHLARTLAPVRWDRLFDDLETQAAAEWEAERAALTTEAERVRVARVTLQERLLCLRDRGRTLPPVRVDLGPGEVLHGRVVSVGVDWIALEGTTGTDAVSIVPMESIVAVRVRHPELLRSARSAVGSELSERVGWGFVLRDLARRRIPLMVRMRGGEVLTGTIDRAGADHCDLALHELSAPRHPNAVTGFCLLPRHQILAVRVGAWDPQV